MSGTLKPYTPSLRDRLRYALMGDSHDSTRAHFINGLLKPGGLADFTPLGIPLNAYDAGRAGASGQYVDSLLSGIAAIPALGPLAGKIAGGVKEARAARMAAGDFKINAFRIADEHANEVTDILAQAHRGANLRSPLPEPASKNMNIEDIIGPRIDQLGTPSKVAPPEANIATDEIWGKAAQQPAAPKVDLSRRGFLGMGAGAAVASAIGLPHFMKPAAEAIQAAAPATEALTGTAAQHMAALEAHLKAAASHGGILDHLDALRGAGHNVEAGELPDDFWLNQHSAKEASMGANEASSTISVPEVHYDDPNFQTTPDMLAQEYAHSAESSAHYAVPDDELDFEHMEGNHMNAADAHQAAADAHAGALQKLGVDEKAIQAIADKYNAIIRPIQP